MELLNTFMNNGPGWFNDIFTVEIFFDADLEERGGLPHVRRVTNADGEEDSVVEYERALFAAGAQVQGFIRVTAPPGRTVAHSGIHARIESGLYAVEDVVTRDLHEEVVDIVPPGTITGTIDFPFIFPGTGKAPLYESYEGELFSVRHTVVATVSRPWYTFEVSQSKPFGVQRLRDIPVKSAVNMVGSENAVVTIGGKGKAAAEATGTAVAPALPAGLSPELEAQLALYKEQTMTIPDAAGCGGSVVVRYDKACYELSEVLQGSIEFAGVTKPVVLVRLAVVRVETAQAEMSDTVIFDETVLDARRWKARRAAALEEAGVPAVAEAVEEETVPAPKVAGAATGDDGGEVSGAPRTGADTPAVGGGEGAAALPTRPAVDSEWMPSEVELTAEEPDPDLPVVGDVSLSLMLDWSLLDKVTPTYVIPLGEGEDGPASTPGAKVAPAGVGQPGDSNAATVRYYVRVTCYTSFDVESRAWNAEEVILYRDRLYGTPIPAASRPMATFLVPIRRKVSSSSGGGAAAPSVNAVAADVGVPGATSGGAKPPPSLDASTSGMSPKMSAGGVGMRPASGSVSGVSGVGGHSSSPRTAHLASPTAGMPHRLPSTGSMTPTGGAPAAGGASSPHLSPHGPAPIASMSPRLTGRAPSSSVGDDEMEDAESGMAGGAHITAAVAAADRSGVIRASSFSSVGSRGAAATATSPPPTA